MRHLDRLISGLVAGDATAIAVLIFTIAGTTVIWLATRVIRRRREVLRSDSRRCRTRIEH